MGNTRNPAVYLITALWQTVLVTQCGSSGCSGRMSESKVGNCKNK